MDRPHFSDEDVERIAAVLSKKDAACFRAYVLHMEGRERTVWGDTLLTIGSALRDLTRLADDAAEQGRINGRRLDALADSVKGYPSALEATLNAHEARGMEALRPVHAAATRVMQAEAMVQELTIERERVEIEARRKQVEADHAGKMETRALGIELVRRAPWATVGSIIGTLLGGATIGELLHRLAELLGAP